MKHCLTSLFAALACCLVALGQPRINGKDIVHDARTGQYLCTVPDSCFGSDYKAVITLPEGMHWTDVRIDGVVVNDGAEICFSGLDGTTPHLLTATVDGSPLSATLLFSCLPLLEVTARLSAEYQHGTFVLHHPDSVAPLALQGRIKWRGHTTLSDDRNKRNFHIKLEDENGTKQNRKLLGMRDDNSWMLDGGQTDLSRIRNHVAHELWLDMAAKPYYADREPKARSAVRAELIELFVNGQYEGIYSLTEAMDRKQLRLARYQTDEHGKHIIHGQLWKSEAYNNGTKFIATAPVNNNSENWNGFDTKYPDIDEVCPTDYATLYNAVNFAAISFDVNWRRYAHEYYDLPVVRDYFIFMQALLAVDNTAKNIYWAVYDKQEDKKLTLAVWDLDCTVGQDWTNTPFRQEDRVGPERKLGNGNNLFGRLFVLIDDYHDGVIERYRQLRKGFLHTDSITQRYIDHIDLLIRAGAASRESARWNGDSDLGGRDLDWEGEKAYIATWLSRRLHYLDVNTFAPSAIKVITADSAEQTTGTYNLQGQRMPDGDLPPGIYVRNGKKIVVR